MGGGTVNRKLFSLIDVKESVKGMFAVEENSRGNIEAVTIDSREAAENSLFIPLPGLKTDGHNYVKSALLNGASAVFLEKKRFKQLEADIAPLAKKKKASLILVDNVLTALQSLGKSYLGRFNSLVKIGITGSSGKTTTKEMLASVLSVHHSTAANVKNLNSEIGVPLTAFRVHEGHEYAVFEMGTNHPGEMAVLADIVRPHYGIITNIGKTHLEFFGSEEAVAREKADIFRYFTGSEAAFLNKGEPLLSLLKENIRGRVILYGTEATAGFEGYENHGLNGLTIHWEGLRICLSLYGQYNILNALAAISAAFHLGISGEDIKEGLESVRPLFGRSQILHGGITILLDCYNSNPDSARSAVEFLEKTEWKGRKIAVLGSMFELGKLSESEHSKLIDFTIGKRLDAVIFFGEEFLHGFELAGNRTTDKNRFYIATEDFDELKNTLKKYLREGDLVLLKASRGVELERLVPFIKEI